MYVLIGKIVNTHGIKGEVRILSDFYYKDKVFKPNMNYYIGKTKEQFKTISYRHHKIFEMVCFEGIYDINNVLRLKGLYVFVKKEDINLQENEYLDEDLIGLDIICNNKTIGKVKKISRITKNPLILGKEEQKTFYIPYNFDIIKEIRLDKKEIEINYIKGLIE